MPFFPNAQNPSIEHSVLIDVAGDFILGTPAEEAGINLLFRSTATEMAHNSVKRPLPPRCHPETRQVLLSELQNLLEASWNSEKRIFWLQGPAGAGKSTIAQTMAELLDEKQMLAGSFFFTRGKVRQDSAQKFVATLCYRLCLAYPRKRSEVGRIVLYDQSILHQTLDLQFQKLIAEPFCRHKTPSAHPYRRSRRFIIIIDGLDECNSEHDQITLLHNLTSLIRVHAVPLSFFITSRLAPHIKECFYNNPALSVIHQEMFLEPSASDVRIFLSRGFAKIREKDLSIEEMWPSEDAIETLVEKSSGYFIYPSTVLRFFDDVDSRPIAQLNIVFSATSGPAYLEMDQLYLNILSMVRKPHNLLVQVLGVILIAERSLLPLDVDSILGLAPGETSLSLRALHPLLHYTDDGDICVNHASFPDFLCDSERAGKFFINLDEHHAAFAQRCLKLLTACSDGDGSVPSPSWLSEYVLPYWDIYISKINNPYRRRALLDILGTVRLDHWESIMKLKLAYPAGHILFDDQLTRIITWTESFDIPPQEKIHQLMEVRDMWYHFVVDSTPLLNSQTLEQVILPLSQVNNTPSTYGSQRFFPMGISPGYRERGGPSILPPHFLCLLTSMPELQYYITSHLNPNASFTEFLCDLSRSKGLYDLSAAHARVVRICLRQFSGKRVQGLISGSTKWVHNLLHCHLSDNSLVEYLNSYFAVGGEKQDIHAVFGWIEKELRIASYSIIPRPVLLLLLRWAEYLWYGPSGSKIHELFSPQDYNCTFKIYLAKVCVSRFKLYLDHWYDTSQRNRRKVKTGRVHAPRFWIASKGWCPLKPGLPMRHSDQYRSIISFLLAEPQLAWETQGNDSCHELSRICSDGRNYLDTVDGGAELLHKYPLCDGWKCSWKNCDRVLVDRADMDGHCLEHFHSFWLSRRSVSAE